MREAESLWSGCENSFRLELNPYELEFYEEIFVGSMEHLRSPFRICRDLAYFGNDKSELGEFFLGCRDLGGCCCSYAQCLS